MVVAGCATLIAIAGVRHGGRVPMLPLVPISILCVLSSVYVFFSNGTFDLDWHLTKYLGGFACFWVFHNVMSRASGRLAPDTILLILIGTLSLHLILYVIDLLYSYGDGDYATVALFRLAPRIGVRYLSIVTSILLLLSLAGLFTHRKNKYCRAISLVVFAMSLLILASLDNRAAWISLAISSSALVFIAQYGVECLIFMHS